MTRTSVDHAGENDDKAAPADRLHRDPADVDGLQPDKRSDHDAPAETGKRAGEGCKPYTAEEEAYANPATDSPTDPDQRAEALVPPRR